MDLSALRSRVANATGLNSSDTATLTKIDAWINAAYQYISGAYDWPWLVKQGTLQTSADITTGTVSINAASTSLTFSSAPSVSVANDWMIQFAASGDWYDITTHTAASTSATLASAYTSSSNLTAGTYTLRKMYYSLPSDVDRLIDMRQMRTNTALEPIDVRYLDAALPNPNVTGAPTHFAVYGLDATQYWRTTLYPTPNDTMNIWIRYFQKITELSATTDTPLVPAKWHTAIVECALWKYGYQFIDDTRIAEAKSNYEDTMKEMKMHNSPIPALAAKPVPWDRRIRGSKFGLTYPRYIVP